MLELKFSHKISEIGANIWNSLCQEDYPFCRYEFLHALESSGSVCAKTGWQPLYIQLQEDGTTIAVMPLYLKNHSYGEYVFDWAWADAYHRYGLDYYPKLVTAIPYSPVEGPRLLTKQDPALLLEALQKLAPQLCQQLKAHSWHILFPTQHEINQFNHPQWLIRKGCQYQWFNRGYQNFDDFLAHFTSRKRKNVKKERQKIVEQAITHIALSGEQITSDQIETFYDFYRMTYLKRGREAYLNIDFFRQLRETMPDNLLLVLAYRDDQPVAGALSLKDSKTLYGRYWGCIDEYDSLHFETCYYQGIDYCIRHQLDRFDSGAQGEHKIQRGFEPVPTWSAHWIKEAGFNNAIKQFIEEERSAIDHQIEELSSYLPFRSDL
ncbi:GNAT family N-acetyltransferase [uncultured Neptuniibacter sp.]|uniref:GNAT family N-acetyltransferase n=1 Tax=uncultured Neptuniibacter sp. TaxID=502143 RepID=UPI00262A35B8|nr:GNAT family N-acetyltransferase [uncultured Neptuniibacter sp.]